MDGNLYHEVNNEEIREYRYSGPTVNNYVTFNNELWRIVGLFSDENGEHLKIVRDKVLTTDVVPENYLIGGITYNIKYAIEDRVYWNNKSNYNNDWSTAGLQYFLNTMKDETTETPNKGYLSILKENAKKMIADTKYYLGTVTYKKQDSSNLGIWDTPKESYINERAISGCKENIGPSENSSQTAVEGNGTCRVWAGNQATWTGKIGLLYPSDLGFSTSSEYWQTSMYHGSFYTAAVSTSWLNKTANHSTGEWFLTPSSNGSGLIAHWGREGHVDSYGVRGYLPVRPSINLIFEVKITSGNGTLEKPYFLSLD